MGDSADRLLALWFHASVLFSKFIQSIPDNQLVRQKLNCMTKIVESDLFKQSGKWQIEVSEFFMGPCTLKDKNIFQVNVFLSQSSVVNNG